MADLAQNILAAAERIRPYVRETPIEESPSLGQQLDAQVTLKLENLQLTGSFKLRGAMNKLLSLKPEALQRGVVAASSGNHGVAVSHGVSVLGSRAVIFVPNDASPAKVEAIRRRGAEVHVGGEDCVLAEAAAREYSATHDMPYVSPYNDFQVVAGQGSVGVELAKQAEPIDTIYVALGGGGLISGIATHLKTLFPQVEVVGCSPEMSKAMIESVRAGEILDIESYPTLSDGTAGAVESGAVTFDLCRRLVDRFVTVSEDEIAAAMRWVIREHHTMVEGAAGAAVAACLRERDRLAGRHVAIVLCGANIALETLAAVVSDRR